MDNRQDLLSRTEDKKRESRKAYRTLSASKMIKDHIERGHKCCFAKYKGNMPAHFVRCVDCLFVPIDLDKLDDLC